MAIYHFRYISFYSIGTTGCRWNPEYMFCKNEFLDLFLAPLNIFPFVIIQIHFIDISELDLDINSISPPNSAHYARREKMISILHNIIQIMNGYECNGTGIFMR